MRIEDIQRMAHDILERGSIENDYIEYKKSATFKVSVNSSAHINELITQAKDAFSMPFYNVYSRNKVRVSKSYYCHFWKIHIECNRKKY